MVTTMRWLAWITAVAMCFAVGGCSKQETVEDEPVGDTSTLVQARFGEFAEVPSSPARIRVAKPKQEHSLITVEVTELNEGDEPTPAGWTLRGGVGGTNADALSQKQGGFPPAKDELMPGEATTYRVAFTGTTLEGFTVVATPPALYDRAEFR